MQSGISGNLVSIHVPVGTKRRRLVMAMGLAITALGGASGVVHADDATGKVTKLGEVLVTGQAASLESALDAQQMADNIVSVVHADAIGQLPDTNVAEALQRLPGVSVERDQGEGRYVRVRGLSPDLNSVTINGSLVPSPESGSRAVALDVLPSGLISSLAINKTLTPDRDANAIGGTIDVKTISAFDHNGSFYSVEGGMSHNTNIDKSSPYGTAAWSNLFLDGKLGVAFGVTSDKREFGSDDTESGGAWDQSGGTAALEEFQRRDYHITRERNGGVLNIDYRPQAGESYYLRTMASRYSDNETRQRHNIAFDSAQTEGTLGDTESSYELKSRKETHDILSVVLGMERKLGAWDLAAGAGFSRSSQDTPDYISSAKFSSDATYQAGFTDTRRPELIGDAGIVNTGDYVLDAIKMEDQYTKDVERNLHFDLGRNFQAWGMANEIKFGGKISRRKKTNEFTAWKVKGKEFDSPAMTDFVSGPVDYPYGTFGSAIDPGAVHGLLDTIDWADYENEEDSRINDFTMHEDIDAAYLQNTFSHGLWRVLAGVRYEGTHFKAEGTGVEDGDFVASTADRRYHNWLPDLEIRRDLDNDTTIRAAWTHAVVRPTFDQLAPGFIIEGDEAEFGNPDLSPIKSTNWDIGIERRLGYAGVISAYLFHKDISDFVYNTDLAGSGRWTDFSAAKTYANGSKARVNGLEIAFARTFRDLPSPWNGLLFSSNVTLSDSTARIDGYEEGAYVTRDISLPSQSDLALNVTIGYEMGPWSLRLAANHKSEYLLEVGAIGNADNDLHVDAQTQYDFSGRYRLGKNMELILEALNLTDEKYYVYTGRQALNAQYETYGRTFRIGLKVASF